MKKDSYNIFHHLIPLEMCIVNQNGYLTYFNDIMEKSSHGNLCLNQHIDDLISIENSSSSDSFHQMLMENKKISMECSFCGQKKFIKSDVHESTGDFYLVFAPFDMNFSTNNNNDELTGLPTRRLFEDRIRQIIFTCQRNNLKMATLFIDLDEFKPVNDIHGHKAGDIVLKTIAQRINNSLRKTDTVARYGGDEFIVVLTELKDGIHSSLGAKRILKLIKEPVDIGGKKVSISASIGIAIFPDDGLEISDLIKKSDKAMYDAKKRNLGYSFFNMDNFLG